MHAPRRSALARLMLTIREHRRYRDPHMRNDAGFVRLVYNSAAFEDSFTARFDEVITKFYDFRRGVASSLSYDKPAGFEESTSRNRLFTGVSFPHPPN